jgi:2-polyprenyl-3-methyl-5-hydroxy-6-metoxy-1,4-benzoquinol methylase
MNKPFEYFERISEASLVSMNDAWFEYATEDHFWMQWRFSILERKLIKMDLNGKPLLEIGCGNGIFKMQMENKGYSVDGCDLNINALKLANKGKGRLFLYNIFDKNPELIGKYKCVFLLDVIEHIKDDYLFVKTSTEYLTIDGYIVLNVPAHNFLFSKYDREAGHIRRYNKSQIKALFKSCNISPIFIGYWGFLLIPVAMLRKIYLGLFPKNIIKSGFNPPNKAVHRLLKCLMHIELLFPFLRFTGTSLIAIGRINRRLCENE